MGRPPNPITSSTPNADPLLRPILEDQGSPSAPQTGLRSRWGDGTDVETIDYYKAQQSDAALPGNPIVGQIQTDFPGFPGNNLNVANFTLDTQVDQAFQSAEGYTNRLRFNEVTTHDTTVDMVLAESGVGSNYFGTNTLGRATSPEDAAGFQASGQYSAYATFNGTHSVVQGTLEAGGVGYKDFVVAHELGHTMGLSHPHLENDYIANGTGGWTRVPNANDSSTDNANFQNGFALNNAKYSVMSYQTATSGATNYGHVVGYSALDISALQHKYGVGDNNTGDTTYNMIDGSQITGPNANNLDSAGNRIALDINGSDESRSELNQAFSDAAATGGVWAGMTAYANKVNEQIGNGRFDGGEETIGRAYKTIYDGQREVDAAGNESIGNGGEDTISYAGAEQSAFINLNDAGLGADQTDAQYLDLQREIKGSDRWDQLNEIAIDPTTGARSTTNTTFQDDIDATENAAAGSGLRSDAYSAGGSFSRLYETNADGTVSDIQDGGYSIANGVVIENARGGDAADTIIGNEHNNRLDGGKGADALYGGHGNDTLNGEDGNDTLVAGRGWNTLDGGADVDTASYRDYYDVPPIPLAMPTNGLTFNIDGNNAVVVKDLTPTPLPMAAIPEFDTVTNVENFEGTARNDTFTVENVSGNMYIDGGAGVNTLAVSGAAAGYTLDTADGTYPAGHPRAGEAYEGKMTSPDGNDIIYYDNIDETNIIGLTPPTPTPDASGGSAEMSMPELGETLQAAMLAERTRMAAEAAEGPLSAEDAQYAELLESADIPVVMNTLNDNGVTSLDVTGPMDTAQDQVRSITEAAAEKMETDNIPYPQAEIDTAHAARDAEQLASNDSYQRDLERGADDDVGAAFG